MTTKERILKYAIKEFSLSGYSAGNFKKIAENAEVSTASIFHHFKTKPILWTAAKEELMKKFLLNRVCSFHEGDYSSFEIYLNTLINGWLHVVYHNQDLLRLFKWQTLEYKRITSSNNPHPVNLFTFFGGENGWEQLTIILKNFQELGEIPGNMRIINLIRTLLGALYAPFHNPLYNMESIYDLNDYGHHVANLILNSCKKT